MKKNILICGASKNLGNYLSKKFEKNNVVYKISRKKLKEKNYFSCDFLKFNKLIKTLSSIKSKSKKIHGVIFCIGDSKKYYGKEDNLNFWKKSLESNLYTFINFTNAFIKVFKKSNSKIIVISSIAGTNIIEAPITYSVSKSALNYYAKIKSKELIKLGIQLNILSLGNILQTGNNWHKKINQNKKKVKNYIKNNVPSNRFCDPDEIYAICENLINRKNSNFIGSNIILDGGQSL